MMRPVWSQARGGDGDHTAVAAEADAHPLADGSLSVGDGFIGPMATAPIDTTTAISGEVVVARRRGRSKAPNFNYTEPVSVIRLELDVTDTRVRKRLERQWGAVLRLRRAVQRDAAARCRAYRAAHNERRADPKALRERLGLSRKGIEARPPRTDQARLDVAGPAENNSTPSCLALHDPIRANS
jgi:hypothetical protein